MSEGQIGNHRAVADGLPGSMKLDDLTLDTIAKTYPEELREPFMWLGWFAREECHRELDVLTTRAEELNVRFDKQTWSKILRGKWNKDKYDNPLPHPVVALPKLLKAIATLREDHRVREMAGKIPFIPTPTTELIFNFIDVRRAPERVNRFGVVVGRTGTQKTATFKEYQRLHNHGLCTWQEAPENGSVKEFITQLSVKYGGGWQDSYERHRQRIFKTVKSRNTIIIDNAQTLYLPKRGNDQPVFNLLRRLQDERQCTVILSITFEFHQRLLQSMMQGYFEQFEGRAGGRRNFLVLPDHPGEEDVLAIAQAFKLRDAEKHLEFLVGIVHEPGRIRRLFEDLQQARVEAGDGQLTIKHVKAARDED